MLDSIESTIMSVSMNSSSPGGRVDPTSPLAQDNQQMDAMPSQQTFLLPDSEGQPLQSAPATTTMPPGLPAEENSDFMGQPSAPLPSTESTMLSPSVIPENTVMENPGIPTQPEDVEMAPVFAAESSAEEQIKVEQEAVTDANLTETPVGKKAKAKKPKSTAKKSKANKETDISVEGEGESLGFDTNDEVITH